MFHCRHHRDMPLRYVRKNRSQRHVQKTSVLIIYFNNILPFAARFRKWPLVATYCIRIIFSGPACCSLSL